MIVWSGLLLLAAIPAVFNTLYALQHGTWSEVVYPWTMVGGIIASFFLFRRLRRRS